MKSEKSKPYSAIGVTLAMDDQACRVLLRKAPPPSKWPQWLHPDRGLSCEVPVSLPLPSFRGLRRHPKSGKKEVQLANHTPTCVCVFFVAMKTRDYLGAACEHTRTKHARLHMGIIQAYLFSHYTFFFAHQIFTYRYDFFLEARGERGRVEEG